MKLVSFQMNEDTRIGAMTSGDQEVVDLERALARALKADGDERGGDHARALIPNDMTAFLQGGPTSMEFARRALNWVSSDNRKKGIAYPLDKVKLLAPVPRPPKVLGIGGNYPELSKTWPVPPAVPPIFQRASSSIAPPGADITIPPKVTYLQAEMELCAVIGRRCHRVPAAEAYSVIVGYMIGNDLSDIDVLMTQWVTRKRPDIAQYGLPTEAPYNLGFAFQSKSWDTTAPTGPYLVTSDEINPDAVEFEFRLNGKILQQGSTSEMLVKIPRIVEYVSGVVTLEPGDILFTGARGHIPPLKTGDVMEHKITGLGSFSCRVVADSV
ncbi:fumarylacetoacetate hydrolase family protein [Petrachloros mirabilis]